MGKTIEEQIAVMQHYTNGGEVEMLSAFDKLWYPIKEPCFNWLDYDYRIKEQKKTVIIEKWLMQGDTDCYFILEGNTSYFESFIKFTKVKLLDTYEVEL